MKIYNEMKLIDFHPWGGAIEKFDALIAIDKLAEVEASINRAHPEGISANELNDFLWFECDDIILAVWPAYYVDKYLDSPCDVYA